MYIDDTIAAIATAPGEAGIGIVRISGDRALSIVDKIFQSKPGKKLSDFPVRRMTYGYIIDPDTGEKIDEVLAYYTKGPYTYTKEDVVEINCHGGVIPVKKILQLVLRKGARAADAGEFTKRAFLNGRIDLAQAEAVMDLISAKTDKGFDVALDQLEGTLSKKVDHTRKKLLDMLAHIEVSIDFAEEDIDEVTLDYLLNKGVEVKKEIENLLKTADAGKILREGLNTVIVGKPNVGKSSLLNALLKESRAIVTEVPGTTRDVIEEQLNIRGIPLKIMDTAGIRETEDIVEKIGVEKSKEFFNKADLVIFMLDISTELTREDIEIMELIQNKKALILINKIDLSQRANLEKIKNLMENKKVIKISLIEEKGLEEVEEAIEELVYKGEIKAKERLLVTNVRHKNSLEKALEAMEDGIEAIKKKMPLDFIEVDIKNTWERLGEITGDTVAEDIIDHIFKNFCIGK
ncbi:tRNA uridine-5-carboxymethylaminomethyl(34) synthesis GTPase MnmE [Clostridium formicaceticum]|uniref:tRNA modification GTPase MnmE n=1 Tax=Clostridium formicaceticum TaxID=1497 RepID=A0AAC9RQS2_9CLOT|nr:tRNA uridine-5-carboxymethylaminomethyl(34) synthesis GTPase MnmE [Clostridium formicaceticum]AOY75410.1 tRNA uridine-5-carboxymethylaminomethyl(34) synthesis GTPase MnmE [Clostridium formicaceticum]ARE89867.1 tRNA modification GTPase MnmE [Clostridium formicaceticum]